MTDNTINNDLTMGGSANGTLLAGRYRVVRQLGQGGMGSVWLAEDTKLDGFKVAIKMLPSVLISNKRALRQVKQEALLSLRLSHPNIATVRAFEEENGNPFLVMDYIEGQTLDDYLDEKGKLTEEETIRLLKPVAAALDYAHSQGVVHRDVKPGNIMIRKDGTPFVLDFGIAREIQETMTRVTGKLSSGTLMYMSPEQLNGAAPKPAQDVYSFAAMAYECLRGEPPFCRGQIEYQIIHNEPESFATASPFRDNVLHGLSKDPESRPQTCLKILEVPILEATPLEANARSVAFVEESLVDAEASTQPVEDKARQEAGDGSCVTDARGAANRASRKSRRSAMPFVALVLVIAFSVCSSLFGYKAYRYSQKLSRPANGAFYSNEEERQDFYRLNCSGATVSAALAFLFVILACGRGAGYLVQGAFGRFLGTMMIAGCVAGSSLCGSQTCFLVDEMSRPTDATRSYGSAEREKYRQLNVIGSVVWGGVAVILFGLLCAAGRKSEGTE